MANILHIESSTTQCSVALSKDGIIQCLFEHNDEQYSHSEKLHVFIQKCFDQTSISIENLDAVAVSKGPGSYTGLRIGVSAAKGICFAHDIPLISVATLLSLAHQISVSSGVVVPLLDARRDEVYSSIYNANFEEVRKTQAEVITSDSFSTHLQKGPVYLLGPGAAKCKNLIAKHPNLHFAKESVFPSAKQMVSLAQSKFDKKEFEDVAYFEPYYLKDFLVTPSKKKLIH